MPSLSNEQLSALVQTGALNHEIRATLGRDMTDDEKQIVDRARVVWRLKRAAANQRGKIHDSDKHTAATAERSKVDRVPCADPARRKRLEADPVRWLKHYMAATFTRPFETPHLQIIDGTMQAHATGGRFAVAAERGIGKSVGTRNEIKLAVKRGVQHCVLRMVPCVTKQDMETAIALIRGMQ